MLCRRLVPALVFADRTSAGVLMTDRKRLRRDDPSAQALADAEATAADPFRSPVPVTVPSERSVQEPVESQTAPGTIHRLMSQAARTGSADPLAPAAGALVRRNPVEQLTRQNEQVKPQKPASLSHEQKLGKFFDVGSDGFRQNQADKLSEEIKAGAGEKARTATPDSEKLAARLYGYAVAAKQKVTADVEAVMNRGAGKREGENFALKELDGLSGKIAEELAKKGIGARGKELPDDVLNAIDVSSLVGDALRFTIVYDFDGFTDKVLDALSFLEGAGYTSEKVGNTFKNANAMYRGINTNWRDGNGIKWELQFHTAQSYDVKTYKNHLPYEGARNVKDGDSRKALLEKQMASVSSGIATPEGLDMIKKNPWEFETRARRGKIDPGDMPMPEGIERIKEK